MARKSPRAARARAGAPGKGDGRRAQRRFQEALDAHRQGRIGDAERLYRDVLGAEPRHVGALQHLGILAQQRGEVDESVRLLMQAWPVIDTGRLVGHSDIAPGRKTDPGPHFDWPKLKNLL